MLTKNKCLLIMRDKRMMASLAKFEAIEVIADSVEVEKVWKRNKTPIIFSCDYVDYGVEVPTFDDDNLEKQFTAWAHSKGFEPGEIIGEKKHNTAKDPCILCAIGAYKGWTNSAFVYNSCVKKEVDCIIYESPNFYVTSELGALKKGFLMIVPKKHYLSVAQFPYELYPEYQTVCEDIEEILTRTFGVGHVAFFEHGSGPSGMTSHPKSIVHAHTHVLHDFTISKYHLDMIQAVPLDDLKKVTSTHYFAYKCGANGKRFCSFDDSVFVPRQFARQIIAEECGYVPGQYNWRRFDFAENIHGTLFHIWHMLNSTKLSSRISNRTDCFKIGYANREDCFEI